MMLVDLHADTPLPMRWAGYQFCHPHKARLPAGAWFGNVDLPRMAAAQVTAQMFGLVALPFEPRPFETICRMIELMYAAQRDSVGGFQMITSKQQLAAACASCVPAGLLCIEGVHPIGADLGKAQELIRRGVRAFGLAHFSANAACRPQQGWGRRHDQGLSAFGFELLELLASQQIPVDLTHINRRGFFDVVQARRGPFFVSHTGVSGVHPHWRNIDDVQIKAVADAGGVIGIIFSRHFLGGSGQETLVRHIEHVYRVGGPEVVALGSDFDGFIVPVRGLRDITCVPSLRETLAQRPTIASGHIDGIMGGNALKFLLRTLPDS